MHPDPGIVITPAGKARLEVPQGVWQNAGAGFESAHFAGEQMFLHHELWATGASYRLAYLAFEARGFKSAGAAKAFAPLFAQQVLARMAEWAGRGYDGGI